MISVCMATYNGERFIKEQIDSILCQLSEDDEVIISDDGSTDKTLEIIESYNDNRIKVFHHKKDEKLMRVKYGRNFYYATQNFENAIKHAQGEYIFLSDQDDIWVEGKKKKCLELLKKYDCVVHNYKIIDVNGTIKKDKQFEKKPIHSSIFKNILDNHFRGCCMAFTKKMLDYVIPIPGNIIGHDYWIGTLINYYGDVFYEMEPLLESRWYSTSVSATKRTSIFYKLKYRLILFFEIIFRIINNKKLLKREV